MNFSHLAHIDDSILATLDFKDFHSSGQKRDKSGKFLVEKMADNFEKVKNFPLEVSAGKHDLLGEAHEITFARGYVGDSRELWLKARQKWGLNGVPAISNYETVSIGLNGLISSKLWHEIHSPSSKHLSLRLLTNSATRPAWNVTEKTTESKEFESLHELKMAVVAMDQCFKKVMNWNASFAPIAIFLHSIEFGEVELKGQLDRLTFVADFVD